MVDFHANDCIGSKLSGSVRQAANTFLYTLTIFAGLGFNFRLPQTIRDSDMANSSAKEKAEKPQAQSAKSKPVVGSVIAAILCVAIFYAGAQFYTARRSMTVNAVALALAEDTITLFRPASGELDVLKDPSELQSPTVEIPLAQSVSLKDAQGKAVKLSEFLIDAGSSRALSVTLNPQGKVCRIRELDGIFSIEGSAFLDGEQGLTVGDNSYSTDKALFLTSGAFAADHGEGLAGYVESGDIVKVTGYGDEAMVIDVVTRAGRLFVSSNVESSRVYVDGVLRGKTPLVVPCSPGSREVVVKADGYAQESIKVDVESMREAKVSAVLMPVAGTLNVTSTPAGASVYVSGEMKGRTPLRVAVAPGQHEVKFELDGYRSKTEDVLVTADYEQPLNVSLVRTSGLSRQDGTDDSRDVTVVKAYPQSMRFDAMYPSGYTDSFSVTGSTILDGWPVTRAKLEALLPGEQVRLSLAADGSVISMSKTYSHSFSLKDKVQSKSGPSLFLGSRWTECVLSWDAVIQDCLGLKYTSDISPGDTVTLYGASADDVRFVRVENSLGETTILEGHLVATSQGFRVFGDSHMIGVDIPQDLQVSDPEAKATFPVSEILSGSRVRFYVSSTRKTVWAELIWRADISENGPLSVLNGATFRVAPSWNDLSMSAATVVYRDFTRSGFYDLRVGDRVLAAGPFVGDIRFIWVQDRPLDMRVIEAVVADMTSGQGKSFYEITGSGLDPYHIPIDPKDTFGFPANETTLEAGELTEGDRVKLWVDDLRKVTWGEVIDKTDFQTSGVYLGVRDGFTYLSGLRRFGVRSDLIITGIAEDETPVPGSRVQVAGAGSALSYMEILTDERTERQFKGTILSSKDLLRVKGSWLYEEFPFIKDTWFVDWELMQDGPVSELFPGDKVKVAVDITDEAMFVERTYSPPFKFEGTIKAIEERTIVLTDKASTKTIEVEKSAEVYKNGEKIDLTSMVVGDKIKVSGPDKNSVDIVIAGW